MTSEHVGKQKRLGFECHDCSAGYAPGARVCVRAADGHYMGPLVDCALPFASPVHHD